MANEPTPSHLHNGPFAISTTRREELLVVFVTVRLSFSLKEACGAQLCLTHHTHKVFRVPHLTQRCDHLENRGGGGNCSRKNKKFLPVSLCPLRLSRFLSTTCLLCFMWCTVPFLRCICCKKHSGPWSSCGHQSFLSQSSALLAGHL